MLFDLDFIIVIDYHLTCPFICLLYLWVQAVRDGMNSNGSCPLRHLNLNNNKISGADFGAISDVFSGVQFDAVI